jgi:hypothetical protein
MATKAEWFRYKQQRSGPKRPKQPRKATPDKPHNVSDRASKKALYALEDAAPGKRPSRKSSRKASNRQKTDAQFRMRRKAGESQSSSQSGPARHR